VLKFSLANLITAYIFDCVMVQPMCIDPVIDQIGQSDPQEYIQLSPSVFTVLKFSLADLIIAYISDCVMVQHKCIDSVIDQIDQSDPQEYT
jgi:branched-subunit amino acid transport protein